ncbi:MAG: MerR family transcriptional regulator [Gammaproteobacteria bacterium]|nr:MerR family transcriptional regulator [Gammaproteobacteria bacterium]MYE52755.1 MerR family transcriptional regulator [Gammaproteobacteria bacterium]MYF51694.1 MerR family transcriptional regulator [Gammaproteobacteria bacterium]
MARYSPQSSAQRDGNIEFSLSRIPKAEAPGVESPPLPNKRYLSIGEVSKHFGLAPHVLRYWEKEFPQLGPIKRRGNRRCYEQRDVLLIARINSLLKEQGLTIAGARKVLDSDDTQQDQAQSKALARQLIAELEELLQAIK